MASSYPGGLDSFTNPAGSDPLNTAGAKLHSKQHGDANDAIEAIQATLGIDPQGAEADVAARLDAIEAGGGGGGGGLVLIASGSFTGAAPYSLGPVFDSTYDDYLVKLRVQGSTNVVVKARLAVSGTDSSTGYDSQRLIYYSSTGSVLANEAGTDEWQVLLCGASPHRSHIDLSLTGPARAEYTTVSGWGGFWFNTTGNGLYGVGGVHEVATAYDSLTILTDTGTLAGEWSVFGYAK